MYATNDKKTSSFSIVTVVNVLFLRIETQLGFHKAVFLKYVFIKKNYNKIDCIKMSN